MILSDRDIKRLIDERVIVISDIDGKYRENIHASSMDMRLGSFFKVYDHSKLPLLDPKRIESFKDVTKLFEIMGEQAFIVQPGEFILGVTMESIKLPANLVARVEGRSSIGRLGIIVHSTAGFIDAGFEGTITLEISNINRMPVALYPGMRICQLAFEQMSSDAEIPYSMKKSAKYQGQVFPEESKITQDFISLSQK